MCRRCPPEPSISAHNSVQRRANTVFGAFTDLMAGLALAKHFLAISGQRFIKCCRHNHRLRCYFFRRRLGLGNDNFFRRFRRSFFLALLL